MACFREAGNERLYSGVTTTKASALAISSVNSAICPVARPG
ncbi:hypothetical protein SGRI78S_05158 [Streptomyces griseus subsp. griseus]